jgi:hypothetical protein
VLGDSVRRRQGPPRRPADDYVQAAPLDRRWKFWIAALLALALPFGIGYAVAVRVLFPPPAVVEAGIPVPRLVGQSLEAAQRSVVEAGLGAIETSELPSLTATVGTVIAQSPLPGQQLRPSAPVRVAVSAGLPRVLVPDVLGFPVERAASLLVRLGFEVQRTDSVSAADAGRVIDINPAPGSRIALPARIAIVVSLGPPPDTAAVDTIAMAAWNDLRRIGWSGPPRTPMLKDMQGVTAYHDARADGRH